MVGHDDEFVEQIVAAAAIMEKGSNQDFCVLANLEDSTALPAFCCDKVGGAWDGSVLRCRHLQAFFRAKAPFYVVFLRRG